MDSWCEANCKAGYCPKSHCVCLSTHWDPELCTSTGEWEGYPGMDDWCKQNCELGHPFCPESRCLC